MKDLLVRYLQSSHSDPVYFLTFVVDIASIFLLGRLKHGLSDAQRALYKAVIVVAFMLTAVCLFKYFGVIKDWKELEGFLKP
ncbi:MAG: hypothetical protein WBD36_04745 [Bacteroidota bacterium]